MSLLQFTFRFLSICMFQLIQLKGKNWPKSTAGHSDRCRKKIKQTPGTVFKKDFTTTNHPALPTQPSQFSPSQLINRGCYCNKTFDLSKNKHNKILNLSFYLPYYIFSLHIQHRLIYQSVFILIYTTCMYPLCVIFSLLCTNVNRVKSKAKLNTFTSSSAVMPLQLAFTKMTDTAIMQKPGC